MAADVMRRDGGFVPSWVSIPLWLTGAATPAMADEATDAKRAGLDPPPAAVAAPPAPSPAPAPLTFRDPPVTKREFRFPEGDASDWYTGHERFVIPQLRVAPGFSARLTGPGAFAAFFLDTTASVRLGLTPGEVQWAVVPQLGYALRSAAGEHALSAGVGIARGVNIGEHTFEWDPRVVLEPSEDPLVWGLRNGLLWDFAENGFSAELSHQMLLSTEPHAHDLRLTVGIDLVLLVVVLADLEGNSPGKVDWD